jgi:hypothetical protein
VFSRTILVPRPRRDDGERVGLRRAEHHSALGPARRCLRYISYAWQHQRSDDEAFVVVLAPRRDAGRSAAFPRIRILERDLGEGEVDERGSGGEADRPARNAGHLADRAELDDDAGLAAGDSGASLREGYDAVNLRGPLDKRRLEVAILIAVVGASIFTWIPVLDNVIRSRNATGFDALVGPPPIEPAVRAEVVILTLAGIAFVFTRR